MALLWEILTFRDVAQLGRVLEWGSRGRKFKSCHPDHVGTSFACSDFFCVKKISHMLHGSSFVAKGHVQVGYSFVNALITPLFHYQPFASLFLVRYANPHNIGTSFVCSDFFYVKKSVTCFTVPL